MRRRALGLVAFGIALAGCGGKGGDGIWQAPAVRAGGLSPGIYVGTDYNSATMLNVGRGQDNSLSGTMTAKDEGSDPFTVSGPIDVTGGAFAFTITSLGTASTIRGTIQGRDIHMQIPQPNGVVEDYVLHPGTVDEYNNDVTRF